MHHVLPFMHCVQSCSCITFVIARRAVHALHSLLCAEPFMHHVLPFMHCVQSCSCITFVFARRAVHALHTVAVHALRAELFMHHVRYCAQSRSCITHCCRSCIARRAGRLTDGLWKKEMAKKNKTVVRCVCVCVYE